jgi:hypothetical protein
LRSRRFGNKKDKSKNGKQSAFAEALNNVLHKGYLLAFASSLLYQSR